MHSKENEQLAKQMGVKKVCLPKAGRRARSVKNTSSKGGTEMRRLRAGIEGRISVSEAPRISGALSG